MFIGYLLIALITLVLYVICFRAQMNFNLRITAAFFMLLVVLLIILLVTPSMETKPVEPQEQSESAKEKISNHKVSRVLNQKTNSK